MTKRRSQQKVKPQYSPEQEELISKSDDLNTKILRCLSPAGIKRLTEMRDEVQEQLKRMGVER